MTVGKGSGSDCTASRSAENPQLRAGQRPGGITPRRGRDPLRPLGPHGRLQTTLRPASAVARLEARHPHRPRALVAINGMRTRTGKQARRPTRLTLLSIAERACDYQRDALERRSLIPSSAESSYPIIRFSWRPRSSLKSAGASRTLSIPDQCLSGSSGPPKRQIDPAIGRTPSCTVAGGSCGPQTG